MMLMWIFAGILLIIGSLYDLKNFTLPGWLLICGLLCSITCSSYAIYTGEMLFYKCVVGLLPGVISLLLSFLTKEQLGYGDGLMLFALGGLLGGERTLFIWMAGLGFSFVFSIALLVLRKGTKQTKLPFIPFLLLGYLLMVGREFVI